MKAIALALAAAAMVVAGTPAGAQDTAPRPDQTAFRALFQELVETNTELSDGDCTLAAQRMAAHLKTAGMPDAQITLFATPEHAKEGGLVAVYPGTSKTLKPMLLLAHIDVVEAKREDWTRDPFKMVEEDGYFYARGVADDKAMAAIWTDMLVRFQTGGYRPKRTIKLALTCGEESSGAFNGADWLAQNKRDLIDAEFALNEGGGGKTDGKGHVVVQSMQVGQKRFQNFRLETTNPGGHSSQPVPDNAIYQLAAALTKVSALEFPAQLNDTTRAFFARSGASRGGEIGDAMVAISKNANDKAAEAILNQDRAFHSTLRTTCVATLLAGGHADNALPQRATANVNCRIFPGETNAVVQAALVKAIGDPGVTVTATDPIHPVASPTPLDPRLTGPAEKLVAKYFPGVPLIPSMSTGATDGIYLEAVGIPTYGVPGGYGDPDGNGAHGLNERIAVASVYTGRDFLTDYVKALADAK